MTDLDQLIAGAREDSREAPSTERTDAMVRHAMLAGRARDRARRDRRVLGGVGAVLAAAAALFLMARLILPAGGDYEVSLPTGDHLLARGDASFEVESESPTARRVRLRRGAVLFDVAPLGARATFEVVTDTETVRVVGTVFVVEVSDLGTSVHVYEGRVEVDGGGDRASLRAGELYRPERATERSRALDAPAIEAAARRGHAPPTVAALDIAPAPERSAESDVAPIPSADVVPPELSGAPPTERTSRPSEARVAVERSEPAAVVASDVTTTMVPETTTPEPAAVPEPTEELGAEDAVTRARAALAAGDPEAALTAARSAIGDAPELLLVEADALRALRRDQAAALAYERVVDHRLAPATRRAAGFLAAELWMRRLRDPRRAASVIDRCGALEDPLLRERVLSLRAEVAGALGDADALTTMARAYLAEFPDGPRASWMRARLP